MTLVGRSEELAFCEEVLLRGEAPGIVVTGAAGVGKTRLASEALEAAEARGYATVRVTATEAGREIPLGPFAHVLPSDADAGEAPLQLLRVVRTAIARREDGRPVVVLVDDAHLLDSASALLVQQLAASREAAVVATVRSGEPVPDAVVALWKDYGCEFLELQPLSLEETGVLVESVVGGDVDGGTKHRLSEVSRGVPLLVRELVQGGLERGALASNRGLWRWHGPLRAGRRLLDLVGARIGTLDEAERRLLELVAVGEPVAWALLESGEGVAAEALMRRELLTARRAGRRLELRLAHPLFGESVRARMPLTRISQLQQRLTDALEATGLRRRGDLLRFATWRLETGGSAPAELLIEAANTAEFLLDSPFAERLARKAVEVGGGIRAERALARALIGQERFVEADAILLPLASRARTDEERASVALARSRNLLIGFGRGAEAQAALEDAAQLVSDVSLKRELELVRSWVLSRSGRAADAAPLALALVHEADADSEFRLRAAGIAAHALVQAGRAEDALALVEQWQPLAEQEAGRPVVVSGAQAELDYHSPLLRGQYRSARFLALLDTGRIHDAEAVAHDAYASSLADNAAEVTALMALGCGLVALRQGRLRTSWNRFREASELMGGADPSGSLPLAWAAGAQAVAQTGDAIAARQAAAEAERSKRPGAWVFDAHVLLGRAWAAAAEGALTEARRSAVEAADDAEKRGALAAAFGAAHDLVRLGGPVEGLTRLSRLVGDVQGELVVACAEHAEALVAGEAARIEAAAARFARLGALLWAAEAESEAAAAHRAAGREQSARAAAARAALLLEHCEGARTPALALAGPVEELTPREREIATLASGGASNREIAERLVVSVRTVENTLQRAYGKLGIGNRRELAGVLHGREME